MVTLILYHSMAADTWPATDDLPLPRLCEVIHSKKRSAVPCHLRIDCLNISGIPLDVEPVHLHVRCVMLKRCSNCEAGRHFVGLEEDCNCWALSYLEFIAKLANEVLWADEVVMAEHDDAVFVRNCRGVTGNLFCVEDVCHFNLPWLVGYSYIISRQWGWYTTYHPRPKES